MEQKKNPKADLNRLRSIFFSLGLIIAMALVLYAFEWETKMSEAKKMGKVEDVDAESEQVRVTKREPPEPKKKPPKPKVTDVLNVVEDDVDVEEEMQIVDMGADEETTVEVKAEKEKAEEEEEIFYVVQDMPSFPGGQKKLREYLAEHIEYPTVARENQIEGKVYVRFCVTKTGDVEKVQVARGVDPLLNKEAKRVVRNMPKWKPGSQRGQNVNVWYTVPINFQLQ